MKQFIRICGIHFSIDGILSMSMKRNIPQDILPGLVNQVIEAIDDLENENDTRVHTVRFENLNSFSLEIDHMSTTVPIEVLIDEKMHIRNDKDADLLQEYIVMRIATTCEPVIEIEDIIDEYYSRDISSTMTEIEGKHKV